MATAAIPVGDVDATLNPRVAGLKVAKTMALSDLAKSMREAGQDVIGLAAGEPDFDTPKPIVDAGIEAIRWCTSPVTNLPATIGTYTEASTSSMH